MQRVGVAVAMLFAVAVLAGAAGAGAGEHEFAGSKSCKKCHLKQYKSWEATKMAGAFDSLKPGVDVEKKQQVGLDPEADYTTDAECVSCHVTGYGEAGGFTSIEATPELAGVGCETCHGPGGTYIQDGYMTLENKEYKRSELVAVGMVEAVGEAQCIACHDPAKVPFEGYTFDYETSKDEGTHESFGLKYDHDD